jgi:GNAT superfamily N-acetyltransferase
VIELREANPDDATAMADLAARAWREAFVGAAHPAVIASQDPARLRRFWEEALPSTPPAFTAVAVEDGEVVGFVHAAPQRDADLDPGRVHEVWGLYVDPRRARRGIGRALLRWAVDAIEGGPWEEATLWTLRDVEATRRFYEALGWRADGAEKTGWAAGHPLHQVRYRRHTRRGFGSGSGVPNSTP